MTFRTFGLGFLLAVTACATAPPRPPAPPVPPPVVRADLVVHVFEGDPALDHKAVGALVSAAIDRGNGVVDRVQCVTDAAGNTVLTLDAGAYQVCATAAGYKVACVDRVVPRDHDADVSLERDAPPVRAVRIDGRYLVDDTGATWRGLFVSGLALGSKTPAEREAFYAQAQALGVNGFRLFGGRLTWAGQIPVELRTLLPTLLEEAAAHGLHVQVAAITDSREGTYDIPAHLWGVAQIVQTHPGTILEIANEPGHPTQASTVNDIDNLARMAQAKVPAGLPYALGHLADEVPRVEDGGWKWPTPGGLVTAHLSRDRDLFNRVRRVRELAGISETLKVPVISGEPDAIADGPVPGKTRILASDGNGNARPEAAQWSFALGALCRGFEIAVCVLHTESGLGGRPMGPFELDAAKAYVAGFQALETTDRLQFYNARWAGSPVSDANFGTDEQRGTIVRAYSFVTGNRGWTVLVGLTGDPAVKWGSGWRAVRVVAERPGVQVVEIAR